ncbi:MAG TPA: CHAT domain-containing protein, partial [Rubrivivax sp.]|nr:CHAT domain-containing protein [Rubrivivax sp.]
QRPVHGIGNTALVVGNPDLAGTADFADLPGAREEARQVAEQLAAAGYDVSDCIDQAATPIMEALHKDSWRILHLAGHGVHEFERSGGADAGRISGMVIGADSFLTPGDIAQMRFVPELVFINCCHLGRVDGARDLDRLGLAANLGEEFIRMGVRAVVAAGWAVDDRAGQAFAATFYRGMLAGEPFGEAVRAAREDVWARCPDVNTWGAYQCYGDPDFRFHREGGAAQRAWPSFGTPHELVAELENLAADLRAGGHDEGGGRIARRLARIPPNQSAAWLARGDVGAALGLAWGEIRDWEKACDWLEKALTADKGECPMRALEQYANYRVRLAASRWQEARRLPAAKRDAARGQQIEAIETAILDLDTLCRRAPTVERLNLLGGAYKRLAQVEDEGERRIEALVNMAHHYDLAYARKRDAYAFTNRVAAVLLAEQRGAAAVDTQNRAELLRELDALQRDVARRNADDPNFWDGASLADLALTRLLLHGASPPRARSTAAAGDEAAGVTGAYRDALARAASPREAASLAENIVFLHDLWAPRDKAMRRILEQIRESLP